MGDSPYEAILKQPDLLASQREAVDAIIAKEETFRNMKREVQTQLGLPITRRLGQLSGEEDSESAMLILLPFLLVLMLVFFLFRKPLANALKESRQPSFTRPRGIRKKAPIFHLDV